MSSKEVKKTVVFFCDLCGTFIDFTTKKEKTNSEIEKLVLNLERLREIKNADEVIFSFLTSDDHNVSSVIKDQMAILNTYIKLNKANIIFGKQFYGKNYFEIKHNEYVDSKEETTRFKSQTIYDYKNELSKEKEVVFVAFADDYQLELDLFLELNYGEKIGVDYQLFSPETGKIKDEVISSPLKYIYGLNDCLNIYNDKYKEKIKVITLDIAI